MLGLTARRSRDVQPHLVPDYSKPLGGLLRDTSRYAIEECSDKLSKLWENQCPPYSEQQRTSWMLSWQPVRPHDDPLAFGRWYRADLSRQQDLVAIRNTRPFDANILELHGFDIDRVGQQTRVLKCCTDDDFDNMRSWFKEALALFERPSTDASFRTTLCAGANHLLQPATASDLSDVQGLEHLFFVENRPMLNWNSLHLPEATPEDHAARRFIDALCNACMRRRAFRTDKGHIGLGPETLQQGDLITVLWGSVHPFVLRPAGNNYHRVVGPCYVQGIMYGEAAQSHRDSDRSDRLYRLV